MRDSQAYEKWSLMRCGRDSRLRDVVAYELWSLMSCGRL